MRFTTVRPSVRNMLVTVLGLFTCFMVIPSSTLADPYWSIGLSGGHAGINGFTLSIGDYGGIPVFIDRDRPRYGHAYEGRSSHHMNRPNEYPRNDYRHNQYRQNMSRPNPHVQNYNRPDAYRQDGSMQNQHGRNIDRQKREKQRQWEMRMMNTSMTSPR